MITSTQKLRRFKVTRHADKLVYQTAADLIHVLKIRKKISPEAEMLLVRAIEATSDLLSKGDSRSQQ